MCRMLAVLGKPDGDLLGQFQNLALTGKVRPEMEPGHNDGWGIAGFKQGKPVYFGRSEHSAYQDDEFTQAAQKALNSQSALTIAHIRKATGGEIRLENTHPFINDGWIFCHNGTLYESENLPVEQETVGSSDSERIFAFLVSKLRHCEQSEAISELEVLEKAIKYVKSNHDFSSLTFFLAKKDKLFAYREFNEESKEAAEFDKYYTLYYDKNSGIICSEPLGNLSYTLMANKELIILSPNSVNHQPAAPVGRQGRHGSQTSTQI